MFSAMQFTLPIGIISHFLLLIIFWALGFHTLALYNIFSVFIFSFSNWQLYRRNLAWAAYGCILLEVPLHAVLATLYLGFESGFWLLIFITVSFNILYPGISRSVRFLLGFVAVSMLGVVAIIAIGNGPIEEVFSGLSSFFLLMNLSLLALVVMVLITSYDLAVEQAEMAQQLEFERAETLLLNILPTEIAVRLKAQEEPLADAHDEVSVLFADIAGFTNLSRILSADSLISLLNDLFTRFDTLAEGYGAEKIKTIGDAYMVAAGLRGEPDHAEKIADLAIGMQNTFDDFRHKHKLNLKLRIGIHSGSVVAGVIGKKKFSYDLWGDTVNLASRMESEGVGDRIQISAETLALLPERFDTVPRGEIKIKGHHPRQCFLLEYEKT